MDLVRHALRQRGTGLHNAALNRPHLLASSEEREGPQPSPPQTVELEDVGTFEVFPDGVSGVVAPGQPHPAVLRCGELHPYSKDEVKCFKSTEFSTGKAVHIFTGTFRAGTTVKEGEGVYFLANGDVMTGTWRNNQRVGRGAVYSIIGYSYEGEYKDDVPCGAGVECFPTGECYCGAFRDGRPHGHGVMYYPSNGSVYDGEWSRGEKHGTGRIWYENGDAFEGQWVGGRRSGEGTSKHIVRNAYRETRAAEEVLRSKLMHGSFVSHAGGEDGRDSENDDGPSPESLGLRIFAIKNRWQRDRCAFAAIQYAPEAAKSIPTLAAMYATQKLKPLAHLHCEAPLASLGDWRVFDEKWSDVHPTLLERLRLAFEALDELCAGSIPLSVVEGALENSDPSSSSTTIASIRRATQAGQTGSSQPLAEDIGGFASRMSVRVVFIDVLCGLFPHLSPADLRRRIQTHITPEQVLRIRGLWGTALVSTKADGFLQCHRQWYSDSGPERREKCLGGTPTPYGARSYPRARSAKPSDGIPLKAVLGHRNCNAGASIDNEKYPLLHTRTVSAAAASSLLKGNNNVHPPGGGDAGGAWKGAGAAPRRKGGGHGAPSTRVDGKTAADEPVIFVEDLIRRRAVIGGCHVTRQALIRYKFVTNSADSVSFTDLLGIIFPLVSPSTIARCVTTSIPNTVLKEYSTAFSRLDDVGRGVLSIADLQKAEIAYQSATANGEETISRPKTALETHACRGMWRWEASWELAHIDLTVAVAKGADWAKIGSVALADILRYVYPSVPCLLTQERLLQSGGAGSLPRPGGVETTPPMPVGGNLSPLIKCSGSGTFPSASPKLGLTSMPTLSFFSTPEVNLGSSRSQIHTAVHLDGSHAALKQSRRFWHVERPGLRPSLFDEGAAGAPQACECDICAYCVGAGIPVTSALGRLASCR